MRRSHEQTPIHDDAPTPEQLFRLAGRGVVLAKEHQRLRRYSRAQNPRSHFMMPPSEVIVPDVFEAPFGYRFENTLSARVSKTDFRAWSMHLRFRYDVTEMGSGRSGERHTYSFRWTPTHTTLARHVLRIIPASDPEIGDYIDAFAAVDELSGDWSWRTQMEEVTSGDLDLLMRDVEKYGWSNEPKRAVA